MFGSQPIAMHNTSRGVEFFFRREPDLGAMVEIIEKARHAMSEYGYSFLPVVLGAQPRGLSKPHVKLIMPISPETMLGKAQDDDTRLALKPSHFRRLQNAIQPLCIDHITITLEAHEHETVLSFRGRPRLYRLLPEICREVLVLEVDRELMFQVTLKRPEMQTSTEIAEEIAELISAYPCRGIIRV